MTSVVKPYLPSRQKLDKYIDGIYERNWLTNNGPLVQELTKRLEDYLGVENLLLVSNGTMALQVAYHVFDLQRADNSKSSEAITTPFTFVATAGSLEWERIKPVFADIHPDSLCLDPKNIEPLITDKTKAIVPVHVYGNGCDVEEIEKIAAKHGLKVIYDAAHAFGVKYKNKSILNWGDAATLSFHATKVFHSIEGGAIVFKRKEDLNKAKLLINFGYSDPEKIEEIGINAKMNEFQAAMGLACLDDIDMIMSKRLRARKLYQALLGDKVITPLWGTEVSNTGAYFPVLLNSGEERSRIIARMKEFNISPRKYFSPSLNELRLFSQSTLCEISESVSRRILCLPLYAGLSDSEIHGICEIFLKELDEQGKR